MEFIDALNQRFAPLSPAERITALYDEFPREKVLLTSSFGTTSALLLHFVAQAAPWQAVHFIDTGYLFAETQDYLAQLQERLGLQLIRLTPDASGHRYSRTEKLWETEPDICCGINKTMPLDEIKPDFSVWMAGLLGFQNAFRKDLKVFEEKGGILRFYPLVDATEQQVRAWFREFELLRHPLEAQGYGSIGCTHCTLKGKGRAGRWMGNYKTECGLHT